MTYNEANHDKKLTAIFKHLGPDALDSPEADQAQERGDGAMIKHVHKMYRKAQAARMAGKGSYDPHYSNSKKNK